MPKRKDKGKLASKKIRDAVLVLNTGLSARKFPKSAS
jgi:hypothetical protein